MEVPACRRGRREAHLEHSRHRAKGVALVRTRLWIGTLLLFGGLVGLVLVLRSPRKDEGDRAPPAVETPVAEAPEPPKPAVAPRVPAAEPEDEGLRTLRHDLIGLLQVPGGSEDPRADALARVAQLEALDRALAALGPEAVELLVELLGTEKDFLNRRRLLLALGEIGSDRAADALADHYWGLLGAERETELNYTIQALGRVDSPHSFDLLTGLIEHDAATEHRFRFVEELGRHSDSARAVPTFLRVADAKQEPYFKARSRAALAIKWANDRAAAPQVESLLEEEKNKYVRQALCGTLGDLGDPASVRRLETIARSDPELPTRLSAIRAISRIGGDDARRIIESLEQDETAAARVRLEAKHALARMSSEG
jgi:HEAT repeat protein